MQRTDASVVYEGFSLDPSERDSLPVPATVRGFGPFKTLVARPASGQYGHLALETLYALHQARAMGIRLRLVRDRDAVNKAIYHVTAPDVRELHGLPFATPLVRTWLNWTVKRRERPERIRGMVRPHIKTVDRLTFISRGRRKRLKARLKLYVAKEGKRKPTEKRGYFRRPVVALGLGSAFCPRYQRLAEKEAASAGIPLDGKIVTLHVREAGFKRGREVHELKPHIARDDSVRNATIDAYFPAIDRLLELGYCVVRIGDPTMTPIDRPGVIDLVQHPERSDVLSVYALLRSEFFLGSESGPGFVAFLTETPTLIANATDPISSFPLRPTDLYLLKPVYVRETGARIGVFDLLEESYLKDVRNSKLYEYVDNSPEEILAALDEMLALQRPDAAPESDAQLAYRLRAERAARDLRDRLNYVRKWGADQDFFGTGRIATASLE